MWLNTTGGRGSRRANSWSRQRLSTSFALPITRSAELVSILAAIVLAAGCRDDGRVPTYPAGGTVKLPDGTPLAGGAILCESPHGLAARAVINDDGTFQLGTYELADGAVEGKHKAAIRPPSPAESDSDPAMRGLSRAIIDDRYLSLDTSGIELDVTADGPNQFAIEVKPPGVK